MPKSKNRQAYEREVRRLSGFIKSAERQGIIFDPDLPPLPKSPARVTQKRLRELQLMTKSDVLGRGYTVDTETGELTKYTPKQSKKRYLSQIKPILTPAQAKKARKAAAVKASQTRQINKILREYKLPESDRQIITNILQSDEYTEAEKQDFIKRHAHFYNPTEFPLPSAEPPEQPPEAPEPPAETPRPPAPDEEPPEWYKVPNPDDFSEGPADGARNVIDMITGLLDRCVNTNTAELIREKLNDKIEEEGRDGFISRIQGTIYRLMEITYNAVIREYKAFFIATVAFDCLAIILDAPPADLQDEIQEAAEMDAYDALPYRRE